MAFWGLNQIKADSVYKFFIERVVSLVNSNKIHQELPCQTETLLTEDCYSVSSLRRNCFIFKYANLVAAKAEQRIQLGFVVINSLFRYT